jgi:hypothetical protein
MAGRLGSLTIGIMALAAAASPAAATDYIYGEYNGDCGPEIGCALVVETIRTGKAYKVTFETFKPHTANSPALCRVSGTATLRKGRLLVGEFNGKPFEILKARNSDLVVSKMDNSPCGEPLKVNGRYSMVGD